ncbi:hypothetical protein KR018_000877, partial [Drosophila ironensis]
VRYVSPDILHTIMYSQAICVLLLLYFACVSRSFSIEKVNKLWSSTESPIILNLLQVPLNPDSNLVAICGKPDEEKCGHENNNTNKMSNIFSGDAKTKASNIAQKAAQEAKAANDAQVAAGEAASMQVKLELAERALQAARAAEAALAGKQQIVEALETEHTEAEAVVNEVARSLQTTTHNAEAAGMAANDAKGQVDQLRNLFRASTDQLHNIEAMASAAQAELAEKSQLLEAAKKRLDTIGTHLNSARQDFDNTKKAAYNAACAAVEARQKAQRSER